MNISIKQTELNSAVKRFIFNEKLALLNEPIFIIFFPSEIEDLFCQY